MNSIIDKECIVFDMDNQTKEEAILTLVTKLKEQHKITEITGFYQTVLDREVMSATAVGYNIGLPHGRSTLVLTPSICFGRLKNAIIWNHENQETVLIIVLIAVPSSDQDNTHMKIISRLARNMMHEEYRNRLVNSDKEVVYTLLKEGLEE